MRFEPLIPFEPVMTAVPPSGSQWTAQIKWDGVRMLHYYDGTHTRLFNRRRNERTIQYPELLQTSSFCQAASVILDGEVIALDGNKPSFQTLMRRDRAIQPVTIRQAMNRIPVTYMVFDLLWHDGTWTTDLPLIERQQLLTRIITPSPHVQLVQNVADGEALFALMQQYDMEGIVYKDLTSRYTIEGKDDRWQKRKRIRDLYAVVGGLSYNKDSPRALLLGLYTADGRFWYIGHAGPGKLSQAEWAAWTSVLQADHISNRPFANEPERTKEARWLPPRYVVKVDYMEWTPNRTMRQPVVQSVVTLDPLQCTWEQGP